MVARGDVWLARLDPTEGEKFKRLARVWLFHRQNPATSSMSLLWLR